MYKITYLLLIFTICSCSNHYTGEYKPQKDLPYKITYKDQRENPNILFLDNIEAIERLKRNIDLDYINLSNNYVSQSNRGFCSIASSVMVFNALNMQPLPSIANAHKDYFTQENILTKEIIDDCDINFIKNDGRNIDNLAPILEKFPVNIKVYHANEISFEEFQEIIGEIYSKHHTKSYIIICYYRPILGQIGGGHFSPIGAYDKITNSALIMDVSRYRYPPFWVSMEKLWDAINTLDKTNNIYRGFIVITK